MGIIKCSEMVFHKLNPKIPLLSRLRFSLWSEIFFTPSTVFDISIPGPCRAFSRSAFSRFVFSRFAFSHFALPSRLPFTSCIRLDQTARIGTFARQKAHLFACLTHTMYSFYVSIALRVNLSRHDSLGLPERSPGFLRAVRASERPYIRPFHSEHSPSVTILRI